MSPDLRVMGVEGYENQATIRMFFLKGFEPFLVTNLGSILPIFMEISEVQSRILHFFHDAKIYILAHLFKLLFFSSGIS